MSSAKPEPDPPPRERQLVPDMIVRGEFSISAMGLHRWLRDASLSFPRPVIVRGRRYFWRSEIELFKDRLIAEAAAGAAKPYTPVNPLPRRPRKSRAHAGGAVGDP